MDQLPRLSEDSLRESKEDLLRDFDHSGGTTRCRACESRRSRRFFKTIPWLLSLLLFAVSTGLGVSLSRSKNCVPKGYWAPTEFETVKKEVPAITEQVRFTAGLRYNESKELYRPVYPEQPQYVGDPTPELDAAWDDLIGAVNVFVTPNEEPSLGGGLYLEPDSQLYMAQVTVFHDLHCLNMIRQNLPYYSDYYPHNNDSILRPHLDHCVDSLRLSLMCSGDMTLSPVIWSEEKGRIIPDFEVVHTCRGYDALKTWADNRDSEHADKWPENAERLHAEGN